MPEQIGNINVPEVAASGTFPLPFEWGYVSEIAPEVVKHSFLSANGKIEQRFLLGNGSRVWRIQKPELTDPEWSALRTFWEARKGAYQPFTLNVPSDDGETTTPHTAIFANEPLTVERLIGSIQSTGLTLIGLPTTPPSYTLNSTLLRFPSNALQTALLSQVQQLIPLVRIVPLQEGYPEIHVSDRQCTVGAQYYAVRLLRWEGIAQSMCTAQRNESDQATFVFGNADRVMRDLVNDVDLFRASIEFSIFHVGTGIKLDFWKGTVIDWSSDAGNEFQLVAADGLYELNLLYPTRIISRLCWKLYNDGAACPYSSAGALDLVHFPTASAANCDHGYDTPNGCLAHGMKRYYGAVVAEPQAVRIKDNSTGVWGLGRSLVTSVSLVADTIYGQPLQEIYTDSDMPVNCLIAAGRDESDFYQALGIVGEGPIIFGGGHKLDGQFHHGYPGAAGLRSYTGTDPADTNDYFSLDQGGNQTGGDWRKVFFGTQTYKDNFSAGVAFLVIRRRDEKGLQLTRLTEHAMEARVAQGLQGWIWTAPGTRSQGTLTNPIWIAVNMLLRSTGRRYNDASTAEQAFDLTAALAAAGIANTSVSKLVGSGTETQFKCRGVISERRALRDWLGDVLSNCLGYYTFVFGKLKLGIRINATALESFTVGNIIKDSLQLSPLRPSFNHLTVNFADEEFEYQANNVSVQDEDNIRRIGYPIASQLNLALTSSKSAAARIATIRLREELGGSTAEEQRKARQARWLTTVLALNVEPGMVVSITDAELPDGVGKFRVERLVLQDDWSIEVEGRTVTDSMYDLLAGGPKVTDVEASPVPVEFFPPPKRQKWHPNVDVAPVGDPIYPLNAGDATFGIAQVYEPLGDSGQAAFLEVTGKLPVNVSLPNTVAPTIGGITTATTGGLLEGGKNYVFAVCAYNAQGFSPPSNRVAIAVSSGTNTNAVTLTDIDWPAGSWDGYIVCGAEDERALCVQTEAVGSLPSSYTHSGVLSPSSWNLPGSTQRRVRVKAKRVVNGGIISGQVNAVGLNSITCTALAGLSGDYTGRVLMLIADFSDGSVPLVDFDITGYNSTTGTFTVTPEATTWGVQVGDVFLVLAEANIASDTTIGDSGFENAVYPDGLANDLAGYLVRIIAGKGRGQVRRIASNTSTTLTIDEPWTITPNGTSFFVIEVPTWEYSAESTPVPVRRNDISTTLRIAADNLENTTLLVAAFGEDTDEQESPEELSPVRMVWMYGKGTAGFNQEGYDVLTITAGEVTPDLADGLNFQVDADQDFTVSAPIWTGDTINPGQRMTIKVVQDATGGRKITWDAVFIGARNLELDLRPETYSTFTFVFNSESKWELRSSQLGVDNV
jgi:hypothetical protein